MKSEITRWYKKTWETKGSRFIASKRLELHEKWSTITISVISVYIISLNLLILIPDRVAILSEMNITFSTICLSILVLVISLFLSSRNYKIRASKLHDCGREINEIHDQFSIWQNTDSTPTNKDFSALINKYYTVLDKYENHEHIDYLMFKSNNMDDYKSSIKHPNVFWTFIKLRYMLDTTIRYWAFILLPIVVYLIIKSA